MLIEIRKGNKITYKSTNGSDEGLEQKDLTTSTRSSIGYSDISKQDWNNIFKPKDPEEEQHG